MGKRLMRTLLGGVLVCMSLATHAAGLGRLTVLSGLGQPLRAEIEVVSLERGEAESLAAKLAATEAFRQANIEISPALQNLRFAVERRANNRYVIVMSSTVSNTLLPRYSAPGCPRPGDRLKPMSSRATARAST